MQIYTYVQLPVIFFSLVIVIHSLPCHSLPVCQSFVVRCQLFSSHSNAFLFFYILQKDSFPLTNRHLQTDKHRLFSTLYLQTNRRHRPLHKELQSCCFCFSLTELRQAVLHTINIYFSRLCHIDSAGYQVRITDLMKNLSE